MNSLSTTAYISSKVKAIYPLLALWPSYRCPVCLCLWHALLK